MESTTFANATTGIVADASSAVARARSASTPACATWERSHASTPVMTTGGVRLLPATAGRLRHDKGAYGATSIPSSGPSASSPPS
ncbi:hypothetical protein CLV37_10546 [Kineococcus rhizosphaerae]|uniref:Uncharacterized protein n=1 Tax=Kineococcus rhizosphaerae TaxID=559628 RepID=A0A2T0R466_9ACTN|nr:hypothetical protein CLV37_10546 [Kineococcus rhizosphaerae]